MILSITARVLRAARDMPVDSRAVLCMFLEWASMLLTELTSLVPTLILHSRRRQEHTCGFCATCVAVSRTIAFLDAFATCVATMRQ